MNSKAQKQVGQQQDNARDKDMRRTLDRIGDKVEEHDKDIHFLKSAVISA